MYIEERIHPALAAHPEGVATLARYIEAQGRFFRKAGEVGSGTLIGDAVEAAIELREAKRGLYKLLEEIRNAVERRRHLSEGQTGEGTAPPQYQNDTRGP